MNDLWNGLKMFLWLTLITGIIYPLIITGIAQVTMNKKAEGGFLSSNGKIVGAELIGQKFESNKYFWGRPSAVDYNPLPSGGSNLGPTSAALKKVVDERKALILKSQTIENKSQIPTELLFASGSGLDPHISVAAAKFQIPRILKARGWENKTVSNEVNKLIEQMTEKSYFALLGTPRINVLKLNLALDGYNPSNSEPHITHMQKNLEPS